MMNLKDAFRAQNKLQAVMDEAICILQNDENILKVSTTHLRSKVMPDAPDGPYFMDADFGIDRRFFHRSTQIPALSSTNPSA